VSVITLDETRFTQALDHLVGSDPDLKRIIHRLGPPPLWLREPGFPTLVQIILEQQVSLASARAAFERLHAAVNPLTPRRFLERKEDGLRQIGFSRQKIAYCRGLAEAILQGRLDLDGLNYLEDAAARQALLQIKGIGPWTADIPADGIGPPGYLAYRRPGPDRRGAARQTSAHKPRLSPNAVHC
jgi:DNA-3-methyladenine glycosylase II